MVSSRQLSFMVVWRVNGDFMSALMSFTVDFFRRQSLPQTVPSVNVIAMGEGQSTTSLSMRTL